MPRGSGKIRKREIEADPKYGSIVMAKFVNNLMWGGKKSPYAMPNWNGYREIE